MCAGDLLLGHPAQHNRRTDALAAPPTTRTEIAIADIWRDLLGEAKPDVTDDFFAVGGHSVLAVQLVRRIEHILGVSLDVRILFQTPTIRGLAGGVDRLIGDGPVPLATVRTSDMWH
jgi:hypothetical protein